ncbi:MAG TPA: lysophospholipid acyltransferase family protein [Gemmatimonadales bacterium]
MTLTPWHSPGTRVPQRGNRLTRALARGLLRLGRWRVTGALPDLPRFVIIVAPHTSNWDFLVGVLAMYAIGLRVGFFGKDTIFRPPLGWLMRWLGGRPVDRSNPHGVVEQTIAAIRTAPRFVLALAPEGTRKRVARWRTGFYHVALGAGIPIVPVAFDYARREVILGPCLWPSGDLERDLAVIRGFYRDKQGKRPELFAMDEAGKPEGQDTSGPSNVQRPRSNV